MRTFTLICLACGLAPILHAQQAAQPTPRPVVPPGPLLEKAPDFAQWTVTSKGSGAPLLAKEGDAAGSAPSATPAHGDKPKVDPSDYQTVVVKTKPIRYEQTVMAGGRKTVKWFLPDLQILTEGSGTPVVTFAGSQNATDYGKADFLGFEWISPRNFEGIQKVSGQDCLIFREPFKVDGRVIKSDPQLMSVACIAVESRLPVALQAGDEVRTYTFGQAPNTVLTLPPDMEALAVQWRTTLRQASRPIAKP